MNVDALRKTEEVLRRVARERPKDFSMGGWKCGTVCCAVGHAIDAGVVNLKWGWRMDSGHGVYMYFPRLDERCLAPGVDSSNFGQSWAAVEHAYDLDEETAEYLFSMASYTREQSRDPIYVANRIRDFIESVDALHAEREGWHHPIFDEAYREKPISVRPVVAVDETALEPA